MVLDNMPAGREMDAMVAEKFGFEPRISWEVLNEDETATAFSADRKSEVEKFLSEHLERYPNSWLKDYHVAPWKHYRPYSTDIAAAWEVVGKIQEDFFVTLICGREEGSVDGKKGFDVLIGEYGTGGLEEVIISADTAPLAICRAALTIKAVSQ